MTERWVIEYSYVAFGWLRGTQYFSTLQDAQIWKEGQNKADSISNDAGNNPLSDRIELPYRFTKMMVNFYGDHV